MAVKSTKTRKVADRINEIVIAMHHNPDGGKSVRNDTSRRDGTKGFGWYTTIDVAYEGMRTAFFRTQAEAEEAFAEFEAEK